MRWNPARISLATMVIVLLSAGLYALVVYAQPKMTLFDADEVAINFSRMDEIFPAAAIPASSRPVPLEMGETVPVEVLADGLEEFLHRSRTTSLIVLHRGRLVHESYYQGYDAETPATSFSVAKSLVSALVGAALDEGAIRSLDDEVATYCPELRESGFARVTIRDLLQMSSGIAFDEMYEDPWSDVNTIFYRMYLLRQGIDEVSAGLEAARPPGTTFHYASINTHVLAMVLEAATGRSASAYLHEKLWEPLGATGGATWVTDLHGQEIGFWGLSARPRDFARLGLLYLQNGRYDGEQLLSAEWVEASTRPDEPYLQPGRIDGDWGYGYQWWVPRGPHDDFSAIGIWGQFIYVNRDHNLVVVKTSADPAFKAHEFEAMQFFRRVGERLNTSEHRAVEGQQEPARAET